MSWPWSYLNNTDTYFISETVQLEIPLTTKEHSFLKQIYQWAGKHKGIC